VLKDGRKQVVKDVESIRAPRAGRDLVLSLDRRLQYLAYRELKAAVKKHKARAGSAVILDVKTGEILAMVNRPSYNPNGSRSSRGGGGRNRALTDVFEPGSAIKPFTVAAALELGRYRPDTRIDTAPGHLKVGRQLVRDSRNYGVIDVSTVIRKSSNVGASRMALDLSAEELWALFARFGFGQGTESGFPGEVFGQLPHFRGWSRFEQATLSFGYGLSVTSLQLARAYASLAADGLLRPTSLLRVDEAPEGEQVISAKTARALRAMLEAVVSSEGTAPLAAVPGYRVGGKTGTARKSVSGGYAKDKYLAIFAGMVPVSHPRLVMVVMIDEPTAGKYYGGQVAAPVFSKVMAGALRLLNIPPDDYGPSGLRLARAGGRP
jgi:cell division protein FtsI (penicillin-binding protein 3)